MGGNESDGASLDSPVFASAGLRKGERASDPGQRSARGDYSLCLYVPPEGDGADSCCGFDTYLLGACVAPHVAGRAVQ